MSNPNQFYGGQGYNENWQQGYDPANPQNVQRGSGFQVPGGAPGGAPGGVPGGAAGGAPGAHQQSPGNFYMMPPGMYPNAGGGPPMQPGHPGAGMQDPRFMQPQGNFQQGPPPNNFMPGPGPGYPPGAPGQMGMQGPNPQQGGFMPPGPGNQPNAPGYGQNGGQQDGFPAIFNMGGDPGNFTQQMFTTMSSQFLPQYGRQFINTNREQVQGWLKAPKPYFAVNNRYVLKKLLLILCPYVNKTWQRRKAMDASNFDNVDESRSMSTPREDINAPDLYIPLMALVSYVLLVGFISGTKGVFTPDKMASTASVAIGVVIFEVLLVRLGFYLINAASPPWLDYVAFRGYKFVGLVVSLLIGSLLRILYYPVLLYTASMMGLFLMRTYRRILLPSAERGVGLSAAEHMKRNYFLLTITLLQYPLYWLLSVRP